MTIDNDTLRRPQARDKGFYVPPETHVTSRGVESEFSGSANQKRGKIRPKPKKWPSMIRNVSLVNGQTDRLALPYTEATLSYNFSKIHGKMPDLQLIQVSARAHNKVFFQPQSQKLQFEKTCFWSYTLISF
jgi:hypothetical protein